MRPAALNLQELKEQLKETKAIGFFSKLTLKNQMDDLLSQLRKYHQGKGTSKLSDLRRSYELLVMKVLSLVQDDDKKLAADIAANPDPQLRMIKALLSRNGSETDLGAIQRLESEMLRECWKSPEHKEAVTAFLEKRAPRFR